MNKLFTLAELQFRGLVDLPDWSAGVDYPCYSYYLQSTACWSPYMMPETDILKSQESLFPWLFENEEELRALNQAAIDEIDPHSEHY